jgi:hypothetical protein
MVKKNLIDTETMAAAKASLADVEKEKNASLPTLKSAKAAAAVTVLLAALPAIAIVVPQIAPFVGAINAVARLFGYGA